MHQVLRLLRAALGVGLTTAAACVAGACEADLRDVTFAMPGKIFRFNTSSAIWADAPAQLPTRECAEDAACCQALGDVTTECRRVDLSCAADGCAMTLTLDRAATAQLLRDVPDLTLLDAKARSRLRVSSVTATWSEGTAQLPPAQMSVFFAPAGVASPGHADARQIAAADLPPLRVGRSTKLNVADDEASDGLQRVLQRPEEPYALLVQVRLPVRAGQTVPRGAFALRTEIDLTTRLGP